jgi:acyl-CoA synthetase (NDP forming)/RimJ/RimL family protein N-acetyltransferase
MPWPVRRYRWPGPCRHAGAMKALSPRRYALLADGSTVSICAARPDDCADVREMHEQMSPDNTYLRFFSLSPMGPEREAQRVCRPEGPDHAALLAHRDGRLVGVASYELTGRADVAEIAFAVPDDMHGRGVATLLLEHLVSLARQRGLTAFSAETLPENRAMQRVFAAAGLPVERHFSDGIIDVTIPLPNHDGAQLDRYLDAVASRASRADVASLEHLLRPASVAVIGAGRRRGSVGREILHNIVAGGFDGSVYAVNPLGRSMEGLACLASADDLPAGTELAVIAVPARDVPTVAAQCGRKGVRALVVITSGLGAGSADLLAICRRYGMRLLGPNCFGLAASAPRLNATFAARMPLDGPAGVVVQSGGVGIALLEHFGRLGIGVSSFVSVGDKYDVSSNDLLTWWEQDDQTKLAVLYVESFGSPRGFARTARRVGRKLPVLTVIGGRSAAGQRAAASHTAASATPRVTQEALFSQAGIIATRSLGELVDAAALLASQPLPNGRRIAIVSNAGGAGVLAADACCDCGLTVATLSAATQRRLTRVLPLGAAVTGPVDTGAGISVAAFRSCLEVVSADEGVDAVLALEVPTAIADLTSAITTARVAKPLAAVLLGHPESVSLQRAGGGDSVTGQLSRIPAYADPAGAARALAHACGYREWRDSQHGQVPELDDVDAAGARAIVAASLADKPEGGWLDATSAAALVACYGIPMVATDVATDAAAAIAAAARLGGRVVLKAEAAGIVHKSQAGAVRLDLRTDEEVAAAYAELASAFGDRLQRVLVQPMQAGGVETIVGVVQEPVFGPLVVFGLGGIATDLLGDRSARLAPLTDADAEAMIGEVRAAPLLLGRAGSPAVDAAGLAGLLLRVSRLADDLPEVAELDLNPVIARPDGVYPVDVRVRVMPSAPRDPFLRQLR